MKCSKCGSENVKVQIVTETDLQIKKHGIVWWIFVGLWWVPIKWFVFTIPALLLHFFAPKKYKTVTHTKKIAVCDNCGESWQI